MACPLCNSKNTVESDREGACLRRACGHHWRKADLPWVEALDSPVRRKMDYGEFEEEQERRHERINRRVRAQAPDEPMGGGMDTGNPNGVMRGDGRPFQEEDDREPAPETRPRWNP